VGAGARYLEEMNYNGHRFKGGRMCLTVGPPSPGHKLADPETDAAVAERGQGLLGDRKKEGAAGKERANQGGQRRPYPEPAVVVGRGGESSHSGMIGRCRGGGSGPRHRDLAEG